MSGYDISMAVSSSASQSLHAPVSVTGGGGAKYGTTPTQTLLPFGLVLLAFGLAVWKFFTK